MQAQLVRAFRDYSGILLVGLSHKRFDTAHRDICVQQGRNKRGQSAEIRLQQLEEVDGGKDEVNAECLPASLVNA